MPKLFRMRSRGLPVAALLIALVVSACGVDMSGEPKIVDEIEIQAVPTAQPTAESVSAAAAEPNATAEPAADVPAQENALPGDFDEGRQIYLAECASCHGAQDGAGPSLGGMADRATTRIAGMSAVDYLTQSIVDPGAFVVDGYQNVMPATFGEQLSQDEITSVVKFIMEFVPPNAASGQPTNMMGSDTAANEAAVAGSTVTVTGHLVQGTVDGDPIPGGLPMQLYALDASGNLAGTYDTTSNDDGSFEFTGVASATGSIYLIQADYAGVPQGAQIAPIQGTEDTLTSDVTLYETTTDPATVSVRWAQMLINYAPVNDFGVEVWLRLELANTGDRIVTTGESVADSSWPVSVSMELPVGSFGIQPMQTEGSERFRVEVVDNVPVVKDTWPLRPGQAHTITVAYYVPYEASAVFENTFDYPLLDATVLLPNDTVTFESDQFDPEGEFRYRVVQGGAHVVELTPDEDISPDTDFTLVKAYDLLSPLAAGERLSFTLTGKPTRTLDVMTTANTGSSDSNTNWLPYVLAALGVIVIGIAGVMWWRQREPGVRPVSDGWQPPDPSAGKDALLHSIAALDDAYEAGHVDESVYRQRRAILTELLIPLLDDEDEADG